MESWLPLSEFVLVPLLLVCGKDSRQNKNIRGDLTIALYVPCVPEIRTRSC